MGPVIFDNLTYNWDDILGLPGGLDSKESTYNVGDLSSIPGLGRSPGGGHGIPFQYSCLENPHGHSPVGSQRVDRTERLSKAKQNFNPAKRMFKLLT